MANSTDPTEAEVAEQLVVRILAGDRQAEQSMVERYQRGLRFMLQRQVDNHALVEDIAQETWRIVLEKVRANELRQPQKLAAFIVQIGRNQLLMHFRRKQSKNHSDEDAINRIVDESAQPEKLAEQHHLKLIVRQLLDELNTERDRQLLQRFYLQEHDKPSICQALELSETHFNRVLFRARQRFRELWLAHEEDMT